MLELDIHLHRIAEAGGEDVDLVVLLEWPAAREHGQELHLVLLDRPGAAELHEGAERVAARQRPERPLHLVDPSM